MPVTTQNNAKNVTTGKPAIAGSIFRALLSENPTIPTDCTTALSEAFKCLGYVSEDGMTNSMSNDNTDIKAWGGDIVMTVKNSRTDTFQFVLIEVLNENVLKAVYGDENVDVTPASASAPKAIAVKSNNKDQEPCCYVVDMVSRDGNPKRIVIPNSKVNEIGDIVYKDDDVVGYDVTIGAEADSEGNTHYEYMTVGTATA
jgi:hypothetical protein